MKIGRNTDCPCGDGQKYKKCCEGKVDWESVVNRTPRDIPLYLSARGKNRAFIRVIADALQLDRTTDWASAKRACTPEAVRKIHEAIIYLWPTEADLTRVLRRERRGESALYVGLYDAGTILRGVTRHSTYADRIILFDPFTDARTVRAEFSPIENPERFQLDTLKWSRFWLQMAPWIDAGLIEFVVSPEGLNTDLLLESLRISGLQAQRPELAKALEETKVEGPDRDELIEFASLSRSDDELVALFLESPGANQITVEAFLSEIRRRRDRHTYYLDRNNFQSGSKIMKVTTGTSHYVAKQVASAAGAHLITDVPYKWKEIEVDRRDNGVDLGAWGTFAKAFQNANLKCLNDVPIAAALKLRREDRLEGMRSFLRRAWAASRDESNEFSEASSQALADELQHCIREADDEWKQIDFDLKKFLGIELALAVAGSGPAIALGQGMWLAGGVAVAGVTSLLTSRGKRESVKRRYPASFFLELSGK